MTVGEFKQKYLNNLSDDTVIVLTNGVGRGSELQEYEVIIHDKYTANPSVRFGDVSYNTYNRPSTGVLILEINANW